MTTVTVLGAGGYLGSAIGRALSRQPVTLRLAGRRLPGAPPGTDLRPGQLDRPGAVARAIDGSDIVIHLVADLGGVGAWRTQPDRGPTETVDVGVLRDLIEFAATRPSRPPLGVVFASTTALNITATAPTAYERHKRVAEGLIRQATADGMLRGTSLRLPTLYGVSAADGVPAADGVSATRGVAGRGAVQALIGQAMTGGPVTVWGDGAYRRHLLHVDDAAAAFVAALRHLDVLAGRPWDVGAADGLPLRDLAAEVIDLVAAVSGAPAAPLANIQPPAYAAAHDLCDAVVDPRPFTTVTGWRPVRGLREALAQTVRTLAPPQEMSMQR